MRQRWEIDELIESWTLDPGDVEGLEEQWNQIQRQGLLSGVNPLLTALLGRNREFA
jgi:hypothetical protein